MSSVKVLSTGGTIASTGTEDGAVPEKMGEELVAAVPEVTNYADISVEQVAQIPSVDMDWTTLLALTDAIESAATDLFDGVVVTHGTDTMEESAYYLDLSLDADIPVVFTGSQRRPDEISSDGPSNLITAVRTAINPRFAESGAVYIAFDEEVHAARDVTKRHTSSLNTFKSPDKGPVATTTKEDFRIFREPQSNTPVLPAVKPDATVRMVKVGIGIKDEPLRDALAAGAEGIVVEGTGLGNIPGQMGECIVEAIEDGIPVVVTSRCYAGATAPVYGGRGGGELLHRYGVIFGGDLPAHKARIKLALGLAAGLEQNELAALFGH